MIWTIIAIILICALAYAIRKGTKNTPFVNNCGCTPNIDHLRWIERKEYQEPEKHEHRW